MTPQKPREIAARVLLRHAREGGYVEELLESALASAVLSGPDRRLCQELVYGVVRWRAALGWLIARKTAGRTQKAGLEVLLQLGLYQSFWLDRIPPHAAVNETVELGRQLGFGSQAGFLNAVLRGYLREGEATERLLEELKEREPAVGWSHPAWLIENWSQEFGRPATLELLAWNNSAPPVYARRNALQATAEALTRQWCTEGVQFKAVQRDWVGDEIVFELEGPLPLAGLESFVRGMFYVQDPSTLLAVELLDPQPGESVLDACAAPGGKTTYTAQKMGNRGRIVAADPSPARLEMVRENAARLGVTCIETAVAAETTSFDRILVDAPCSNTGVIRRRVDLRWRLRPEEIPRLAGVQREILNAAAMRLKPGGLLVYSTCSLEGAENHGVIEAFLAVRRDFRLERERALMPFRDGVDGAYVARLMRTL